MTMNQIWIYKEKYLWYFFILIVKYDKKQIFQLHTSIECKIRNTQVQSFCYIKKEKKIIKYQ